MENEKMKIPKKPNGKAAPIRAIPVILTNAEWDQVATAVGNFYNYVKAKPLLDNISAQIQQVMETRAKENEKK